MCQTMRLWAFLVKETFAMYYYNEQGRGDLEQTKTQDLCSNEGRSLDRNIYYTVDRYEGILEEQYIFGVCDPDV